MNWKLMGGRGRGAAAFCGFLRRAVMTRGTWLGVAALGVAMTQSQSGAIEGRAGNDHPWQSLFGDYCWLHVNAAWEVRDERAVRRWIDATLLVAPSSVYFRTNAARMIAYDFPAWRSDADANPPKAIRAAWRRMAADEAIAMLLDGCDGGPSRGARTIEAATVALYGKQDLPLAARLFREAAESEGAPWHAGRIHAQILIDLGRLDEAARWLAEWELRLPADDPAAQRDLVRRRLAEVRSELDRRRSAP